MSYIVDRKNETFFVYFQRAALFYNSKQFPFVGPESIKSPGSVSWLQFIVYICFFSTKAAPPILDTLQGVLIVTDHKLKAWAVALQGGQAKTSNGTAKS